MTTKNEEQENLDSANENDIDGEGLVVEVDVIDDTPIEDRGRKPLKHDALATNDDDAIAQSEAVKKRIGELRHAAHDERRRREAAERQLEEATRVASLSYREAKELKKKLTYGEANYATKMQESASLKVKAARDEYRAAYETGDPDALADANVKLGQAIQEEREAAGWVSSAQQTATSALQEEKDDVESRKSHQPQQQQRPEPDVRAKEWAESNSSWYGTDPEMTALAYGVHEKLVKSGVHPVRDADKYYSEINATMRRRFPEYEWDDGDDGGTTVQSPAKQKPAGKPSSVAPVARSSSSGGQPLRIKLTASQVALAEKLGITKEQYAAELHKQNQGA